MQAIRLFLLSALFAIHCYSQANQADVSEQHSIASPDKQLLIVFSGGNPTFPDAFRIQDNHGNTLVSSHYCPSIPKFTMFQPEYVLWSLDAQAVAVAGGVGKELETYVFVHQNNRFVIVPLPDLTEHNDNPYVRPIKWMSGHRLVLDISGPHAGHVDTYYSGRATICISVASATCETLYHYLRYQ